ncbi:MAG TPA: hypothetical protein PLJ62_09670 [Thermoflexales bacterium]|nr:hypothetical protein [Thermoflexales bacterium]HQW36463.1 hypothetical protein [Thermoflexales bacterium]HRA00454.1 hypothetical protein [Thermoflexales bacterium]
MNAMKLTLAIFGCALLAACGGNAPAATASPPTAAPAPTAVPTATPTALKLFTSNEGKFAVWMPGEPKKSSQTVDTAGMKIDVTFYTLEIGTGAYLLGYNDYPADKVQQADAQNILDGARDGGLKNINATLLSETKIEQDGFPGRDITARASVQGREYAVRIRVFLVNNRLYQQMVLTEPGKIPDGDIAKFVDSFKLLK